MKYVMFLYLFIQLKLLNGNPFYISGAELMEESVLLLRKMTLF